MLDLTEILGTLKSHYDKLMGVVVLVGLVASLLYLAVEVGSIPSKQTIFEDELRRMRPMHPVAARVSPDPFTNGMRRIRSPEILRADPWTNAAVAHVFVPEARVWCEECRQPIPYAAVVCPKCGFRGTPPDKDNPLKDSDGDGMPDMWERKHGLNPADPTDAAKDKDGDGFTNYEECVAKTDPGDLNSIPAIEAKFRVVRIVEDPFKLRFKSVSRMPETAEIGLPTNAVVALPDKRIVRFPSRSSVYLSERQTGDMSRYRYVEIPAEALLRLSDRESHGLPEKTRIRVGKDDKFDLGPGPATLEAPARSGLILPPEERVGLADGSMLRFPDGKTNEIPKGSDVVLPGTRAVGFSSEEGGALPEGLEFRPVRRWGAAFAEARLPEGCKVEQPGKEALKLGTNPAVVLRYGLKFQLNLRGDIRTYFANMGDEVEGFVLDKYEPRYQAAVAIRGGGETDVSVLTLRRGEALIPLKRGEVTSLNEYIVFLRFLLDNSEFKLKVDDTMEIRYGKDKRSEYRLTKSIDTDKKTVVLERLSDGTLCTVRQVETAGAKILEPVPVVPAQREGVPTP